MSVEVETICPKCNHMSWAGEIHDNRMLQHCAYCKETFTISTNGNSVEYFYSEAMRRLAIWQGIRESRKVKLSDKLKNKLSFFKTKLASYL